MVTARLLETRPEDGHRAGGPLPAAALRVGADAAGQLTGGLLVTVPTPAGPGEAGTPSHRLLLLGEDGEVLAEHLVPDAFAASGMITRHPDSSGAVVELPMGQDGTFVLAVRVLDGALEVREILPPEELVCGGFSPDGTRLLLLPYPNDPEMARVVTWSGLDVVASLDASTPPGAEGFNLSGCFVRDDLVALTVIERGVVVTDAQLRDVAVLELPGVPALDDEDALAEIEWVEPLGESRIAVGLWQAGAGRSVHVYAIEG